MAFDERRACLWHAYNALDVQGKEAGIKSQLKVLTHNIATSLGIQEAEKGLDDYRSTNNISFADFLNFLKVDVFDRLKDTEAHKARATLEKVDEVCWLVCAKRHLAREGRVLSESDTYRLWRIFNFLAETGPPPREEGGRDGPDMGGGGGGLGPGTGDGGSTEGGGGRTPGGGEERSSSVDALPGEPLYPVVMDSEEVHMLICKFLSHAGRLCEPSEHDDLTRRPTHMHFEQFLGVFESRCCMGLEQEVIAYSLQDMYDEYITQILMKGLLVKKGHVITNWRERWFVLTPGLLRYYTARDEREIKGEVIITANCKVEMLPDKTGTKPHRFQLISEGKVFEFSAPDIKTRSEWVSASRSAIEQCNKKLSIQRLASQRRRVQREERRSLEREEVERRRKESQLIEQTRLQLEQEKQARAAAEAKLQEELQLRAAEEERRKELETIQEQLQALLEEERQAKRDEEIVRNLQARILAEEFEKREQLERLKEEQEAQLWEERKRRENLEDLRELHQAEIREERRKLDALKQERESADDKLQEALKKLYEAEWAKAELQARLKEKEQGSLTALARTASAGSIPFVTHRGPGAFSETEFGLNALRSPKARTALNGTSTGGYDNLDETSEELVFSP